MGNSPINDKQLLGRLLGETYRLQNKLGMKVPISEGNVYGLLHGVEEAFESVRGDRWYDQTRIKKATDVLCKFDNAETLADFKGYYDLEHEWTGAGLDRSDAIVLFTYFYNNGRFVELIKKMNSSHSPAECKTFSLSEFDK